MLGKAAALAVFNASLTANLEGRAQQTVRLNPALDFGLQPGQVGGAQRRLEDLQAQLHFLGVEALEGLKLVLQLPVPGFLGA